MDISFIIPFYNLPTDLLKRAIQSVINQWDSGYNDYEIIVVDDGSHTPPKSLVDSFHNENIRLYCRRHARQGAARNFGLSIASGKYIMFLDSDDYLLPHSLSTILSKAKSKGYEIVRFQTVITKSHITTITPTARVRFSTPTSGENFMLHNNLPDAPWSFFFLRELAIKNNVWFQENVFLEDSFFTTSLHHYAKSVTCTSRKVLAYYQRQDSTINLSSKEHKEILRQHHIIGIELLTNFIINESTYCSIQGLQRKKIFLIVDYIRRICGELTTSEIINNQLPILQSKGFYPLPITIKYGLKYFLFAVLAKYKCGIHIIRSFNKSIMVKNY